MTLNHWIATAILALFMAGPALGLVVVEEDFEDDMIDESLIFFVDENGIQRQNGHHGDGNSSPKNPGRPGTWIENQYPVGDANTDGMGFQGGMWFEPDAKPDTNWQTAIVGDFTTIYTHGDPPARPGKEGFIAVHDQTDCTVESCDRPDGLLGSGSQRLNRDGFIQFSDANGTPVPANQGDVLRGQFDFVAINGIPLFGLTSDVMALAETTSKVNEDINGDGRPDHQPLTKWIVGFGQPFHPLDVGIPGWQTVAVVPEIVAQLEFASGYNYTWFMTRTALPAAELIDPEGDCQLSNQCSTQVHLDPDTDQCFFGDCVLTAGGVLRDHDLSDYVRYQTLSFQYTVGNSFWDMLQLDGEDVMACDTHHAQDECDDPDTPGSPMAGNVPITRPGNIVDGLVFGTSRENNAPYFLFDEICVTINQELDGACTFTRGDQPGPLLGDANNNEIVTGADLISVQQNFGKDYTNGACDGLGLGDANDDCLVTGADLIVVQQNFGNTLAPVSAEVPEPTSICLLALASLGAMARRRRLAA